jgi:hypothetical protein
LHPKRSHIFLLLQKGVEIKFLTAKYSDTSAKFQDLSSFLDDGTLLAELHCLATTTYLNVSLVNSEMRDTGGVNAATLAKNWGVGIEAAKRTRLVTTQRGIGQMIHPSLMKLYRTSDRQLRYHRLSVTMFTDKIYSTILSRQHNKAAQVFCTDSGFVRAFPMKLKSEEHEALSIVFHIHE